jgi:hypothetical protein
LLSEVSGISGETHLLQSINRLRDAAQHDLLDVSEGQLYIQVQAGVTLFRDLLHGVFTKDLRQLLPARILPISTSPPTDLLVLFEREIGEIRKLLRPGSRRRLEAHSRLRPLQILDASLRGSKDQPSPADLNRLGKAILAGAAWEAFFPGVAAVDMAVEGSGPSLSLRLTKKEGVPVALVPEGTAGAVVAIKRVDELGYRSGPGI